MRLPEFFGRDRHAREPGIGEIVQDFENFGDNCEFGMVQRYAGVEPLGLFRFSSTSDVARLRQALDTDFADYGVGDDLMILREPSGALVCRSRRYGFGYAVSDAAPSMSLERVQAREARKIGYLKRRLLEDLAVGGKILVRKGGADEGPGAIAGLARALRRHGPVTLLHVAETGGRIDADTVRWREEGVLEGTVPRFAPLERAYEIDLDAWLSVCRQAYRLVHGLGVLPRRRKPKNLLADPPPRPVEHVLGHGTVLGVEDLELFGTLQATSRLDPEAVHTFSAWIWIPSGFEGGRIDAAISHYRLGWRSADLSVREVWQRVWIGARIPRDVAAVVVGVVVAASAGQRLWSTGWCLEEGPVPAPAQPPSIRIGPVSGR